MLHYSVGGVFLSAYFCIEATVRLRRMFHQIITKQ